MILLKKRAPVESITWETVLDEKITFFFGVGRKGYLKYFFWTKRLLGVFFWTKRLLNYKHQRELIDSRLNTHAAAKCHPAALQLCCLQSITQCLKKKKKKIGSSVALIMAPKRFFRYFFHTRPYTSVFFSCSRSIRIWWLLQLRRKHTNPPRLDGQIPSRWGQWQRK